MKIIGSIPEVKAILRPLQAQGLRIGLVPTMGALHAGHLSLVREAKKHAEVIVASIFVNPKQFGPSEDLTRYPRDLEGDAKKLEGEGVGVLFAPAAEVMYPEGHQTGVSIGRVSRGLCGDHRPGHFDGVATVVLELFSIVRPDVAVFGEKDFQQLAVLRALARDLHLDVRIAGAPLVREADGLAMSSRNVYLSPDDRTRALSISAGLFAAKTAYDAGERAAETLLGLVRGHLSASGLVPEYLELRRFEDLAPLDRADAPSVLLTAVRVGSTRLIDNLILRRP
jgi:pantoate--beta-alanine ligase